jgi:hypothetical protein
MELGVSGSNDIKVRNKRQIKDVKCQSQQVDQTEGKATHMR